MKHKDFVGVLESHIILSARTNILKDHWSNFAVDANFSLNLGNKAESRASTHGVVGCQAYSTETTFHQCLELTQEKQFFKKH